MTDPMTTVPPFSVISGAQVAQALHGQEKQITELVEATYRWHGAGDSVNPPSYFLRFPDRPTARIIALPASLGGKIRVDGLKWISSFPDNVAAGIPRASAVLILNQDSSTLASEKWTVPFEATQWSKGDVFQIRSQSMALGYVTIGTNRQRTFVVKANQPFIFEEAPQQVHIVDGQGNTWSVTTARAEAQRQAL